jgi:hypothetical protein
MKCKQNEEFVYQAVLNGDLEISLDGTIWRLRKRGWDRWKHQVVSRPCKRVRAEHDCGAYLQVRIMLDGVRVYALAHRLVYRHFKGAIPDSLTINHEDGKKKRNHPDNLELATYSEQQIHATRILKVGHACNQDGMNNSMAVLTDKQVAEIRERRASGEKLVPIATDYGIAFQTVSRIARGDRRLVP